MKHLRIFHVTNKTAITTLKLRDGVDYPLVEINKQIYYEAQENTCLIKKDLRYINREKLRKLLHA